MNESLLYSLSNRALQSLSPLLTNWSYIPFTNYAAGPFFYTHICNEIIINTRHNIVELGSGISTILIARLFKVNNIKCKFISIDHDAQWQNVIQNILIADHIENLVKFISSPITNYGDYTWYDPTKLHIDPNIDMLIVDGPPGFKVPFARYGAIDFFKNLLDKDNFTIFLHDTDRDIEKTTINRWAQILDIKQIETSLRYSIIRRGNSFTTTPQTIV